MSLWITPKASIVSLFYLKILEFCRHREERHFLIMKPRICLTLAVIWFILLGISWTNCCFQNKWCHPVYVPPLCCPFLNQPVFLFSLFPPSQREIEHYSNEHELGRWLRGSRYFPTGVLLPFCWVSTNWHTSALPATCTPTASGGLLGVMS